MGCALEILDRERGRNDVAAPADALGELSLAQPHPGGREAEPHDVAGLLLALRQRLRGGAAVRVPAQRADVVALALTDDSLLEQQRGLAARRLCEPRGLSIRVSRVLVLSGELRHVAQRLPHVRDGVALELGKALLRVERAAIELRGVRIRRLRASALGGDERVAPRLPVHLCAEEVQREDLGELLRLIRPQALVRFSDAGVKLAPASIGEALVRRVAEERVAEPIRAGDVRVAFDELGEPVPRLRVRCGRGIAGEHELEHVAREGRAEHGGPTKECAVRSGEAVDARADQRLHGVGKIFGLLGVGAARGDELLEEERVASGALRDRVQLVACETLGRGGDRELSRVLVRERIEPDRERRNRRRPFGRREATRNGAAGRAREPGFPLELEREVPEQVGRRLVHPVDVLEQDHGRRSEERLQQRRDDAVKSHSSECRLQVVDLRSRLDRGVEREPQERDPGHELRRERLEPTAKRRRVLGRIGAERDVEQAADRARGTGSTESSTRTARRQSRPATDPLPARALRRRGETCRSRARRSARPACRSRRARGRAPRSTPRARARGRPSAAAVGRPSCGGRRPARGRSPRSAPPCP